MTFLFRLILDTLGLVVRPDGEHSPSRREPVTNCVRPDRAWNPLDGGVAELGMHLTVGQALRHDVVVGIAASLV